MLVQECSNRLKQIPRLVDDSDSNVLRSRLVTGTGYPDMSVNSTSKFKVFPANGWLASNVTVSSSIPVIETTKIEPSFCLT
jgi:hypothetical protein